MATQTSNLALVKPAKTEKVSVDTINSNMDKIDTGLINRLPKAQKTKPTQAMAGRMWIMEH